MNNLIIISKGGSGSTINLYDLDLDAQLSQKYLTLKLPVVSGSQQNIGYGDSTASLYSLIFDEQSGKETKKLEFSKEILIPNNTTDYTTLENYFLRVPLLNVASEEVIFKNININPDIIYELIITVPELNQSVEYFVRFLTIYDSNIEIVYSDNPLDIAYKLNNLHDIIDIDKIFLDIEKYNFQYNPTEYNPVTKKYVKNNLITNRYNNSTIIQNLTISQYASEFTNFFNDIENSITNNTNPNARYSTQEQIAELKTICIKYITLINNLKGNLDGISMLFTMFAEAIGYTLISITEDVYENFSYIISSTLPVEYWERDIKPIIHPLSWKIKYNELTSNNNSVYINTVTISTLNSKFYTFYETKQQMNEYFMTNYSNVSDQNITQNVAIEDLQSHYQMTFANNHYLWTTKLQQAVSQADLNVVESYLQDTDNIGILTMTITGNNATVIHSKSGIGFSYNWEIYNTTTLISKFTSIENQLDLVINNFNINDLVVKLILNNNQFTINQTVT